MWGWLTKWWNVLAVRKRTVELCGFLPTMTTVANIFAAGNPAVASVSAVATAICTVMSPRKPVGMGLMTPPTDQNLPPPYVNGVLIEGSWTK